MIWPLFFSLDDKKGDQLGVPDYDDLSKSKWSLDLSFTGSSAHWWGNDEWLPERIIAYYRPAAWNPHEPINGAPEPIYNLNRIIWLQAVLEIITNKTATDLDLLSVQATQIGTAILQHRLVLDYLLAEQGRGCGKFNDSNCYLQTDDSGEVGKKDYLRNS